MKPFNTKQIRAWDGFQPETDNVYPRCLIQLNSVDMFINGVMKSNDRAPSKYSFAYCGLRVEPQKNNQSNRQGTNDRRFVTQVA